MDPSIPFGIGNVGKIDPFFFNFSYFSGIANSSIKNFETVLVSPLDMTMGIVDVEQDHLNLHG